MLYVKDFKTLQNGSDIRGVALTDIPEEKVNLREGEAECIGAGFLLWLSETEGKKPSQMKIAIGRDPRVSGQMLLGGLVLGMGPYCTEIYDCGLASTPAMFMSTVFDEFDCDGAIMITASHLPYNRNGFKFFTRGGGLNKKDITQILEYAGSGLPLAALGEPVQEDIRILGKKAYPTKKVDLMSRYCEFLKEEIKQGVDADDYDRPLAGLKIAVDAGNGGGGFYAREILKPLGADISGSQFLSPDGTFPNHAPNPEDKEAMASISLQVIQTGSDFGLIFDTDVDRSAAVDSRGREVARNGIVAMAAALVAEKNPGSTIVTDSVTSNQLTEFIEGKLGLKHLRFKRGYRNVINKAIELNEEGIDCPLAIETSGHAALRSNFFLDDGAYLATLIVIKAAKLAKEGKKIDDLIADLENPAEATEYRFPITAEDFKTCGDKVLEGIREWALSKAGKGITVVEPNYEGVRLDFDETCGQGWCLLRKSLHDPLMPMNLESDRKGGVKEILAAMEEFFADCEGLDTSKAYGRNL